MKINIMLEKHFNIVIINININIVIININIVLCSKRGSNRQLSSHFRPAICHLLCLNGNSPICSCIQLKSHTQTEITGARRFIKRRMKNRRPISERNQWRKSAPPPFLTCLPFRSIRAVIFLAETPVIDRAAAGSWGTISRHSFGARSRGANESNGFPVAIDNAAWRRLS